MCYLLTNPINIYYLKLPLFQHLINFLRSIKHYTPVLDYHVEDALLKLAFLLLLQ